MAIQKVECFVPYCDECGQPIEHDYIEHYDTEADARDGLQDAEWSIEGDKILCWDCTEKAKGAPG